MIVIIVLANLSFLLNIMLTKNYKDNLKIQSKMVSKI